jgi:TolB-like protein/tetratricopeptide (TPR) repeat protein
MQIWSAEIKELEKLNESFKGQLPDLEKELGKLIKADDENMILLYSRRCLEVIITDLCECELQRPRRTEPLKGIIDKLHKEEKVPSHIISSMHGLNELSTYGAHPKDFDPEQVKPVLNNLDIIIKWYLQCKNTGSGRTANQEEEVGQEIKSTENVKKDITISRKRLAGILGGLIGIIASVFAVLYFSNIIGGSNQTKEVEKSIAVLPFRNLSNDTTQLYFSDGIVEAILDHLFKVGELKVISSTSTKRYRDTELSIKDIARELGVASILEGSVQKIGNSVRITAQLIEAKTDVHLWSETYDRDLSDIFSIQTEVAQNVAKELKATLTPEEKGQIKKNQTENPEAYNSYLQGRFFIQKRTNEGFRKSIEYFEKAVAEDQDYALAYAGLADAYFLLPWYSWIPKQEDYAKSKEYVNKALEIDKNLAEAHAVLGAIFTWNEWKWEEARKELQLAVELNPNFVNAHSYYAELFDILRENEEARKQINITLSIDPFFTMMYSVSGFCYYHEGKFKESLDEYKKAYELDPDYEFIYWGLYSNYTKLGEDLKAIDALQEALLRGDSLQRKNAQIVKEIFTNSGIKGIKEWLIESELKKSNPSTQFLATNYAIIGKKEDALYWLEKTFENPPSDFPRINNNPDFDNIRSEPRFQTIIKRMGLSEYQIPK